MQINIIKGLGPEGFHNMSYAEWGTAKARKTAFCVHGLTRNGRDFDYLAKKLGSEYRVFCPDLVGRGKSDRFKNSTNYRFEQYLADLNALIARSGASEIDWIGTSLGGLLGIILAAQHNTPIRKLVINDVGPAVPQNAVSRIKDYVEKQFVAETLEELEQYMRQIYAPFGFLTDEQWAHLLEFGHRTLDDGRFTLNYDPYIASNTAKQADFWSLWPLIKVPTLVIHGVNSDILPQETIDRMKTERPDIQVVDIPDTAHAPALMSDEQTQLIKDFLKQ